MSLSATSEAQTLPRSVIDVAAGKIFAIGASVPARTKVLGAMLSEVGPQATANWQRLADRIEGFSAGRIEKAASVDENGVSAPVIRRDLIALGLEARNDALGIDQRLRTTEAHNADPGGFGGRAGHGGAGLARRPGMRKPQRGRSSANTVPPKAPARPCSASPMGSRAPQIAPAPPLAIVVSTR